jgi:AraC-like DNA-binding protein
VLPVIPSQRQVSRLLPVVSNRTGRYDCAQIMNGKEVVPFFGNAGRHSHGCAFAALVLKGGYEESGDAGRFDVREGDVILHQRFEAHCNRGSPLGAVILHVALPGDADFQAGAGQLTDPDLIAREAERSPASAAALLLQNTRMKQPRFRDWPEQLAAELSRNTALNLTSWSHEQGIAPWTVSRGFESVFGVSPSAFRVAARARHAWHAIRTTSEPLVDIAARLGFADQAHMSRSVKYLTGNAPRVWRTCK